MKSRTQGAIFLCFTLILSLSFAKTQTGTNMTIACDDYRTGKRQNTISAESLATQSGKATLGNNKTLQWEALANTTAEAQAAAFKASAAEAAAKLAAGNSTTVVGGNSSVSDTAAKLAADKANEAVASAAKDTLAKLGSRRLAPFFDEAEKEGRELRRGGGSRGGRSSSRGSRSSRSGRSSRGSRSGYSGRRSSYNGYSSYIRRSSYGQYGYYGIGGSYGIIIIGGQGYYYGAPYRAYYYGHYYPPSSQGSCAPTDFECICLSQYSAKDEPRTFPMDEGVAMFILIMSSLCCCGCVGFCVFWIFLSIKTRTNRLSQNGGI